MRLSSLQPKTSCAGMMAASIWIFILDKLEALLAELWKAVLSHCRCLKVLLLCLERKVISFLMKTRSVVVGGFFLALGSSMYSIGKWISGVVASCLGQESVIFLCERCAQNQTWHHSCCCASDWANAIIIISILCSIPFLMLPNSLFAFYSPIKAVHCLHRLSSVLCQISSSLAVCGWVRSELCISWFWPSCLINSSHCQDLQETHIWFCAVSAIAV